MSNRLQFWLGLLFGLFTAFRLRLRQPVFPDCDFTDDAWVICDRAGKIVKSNAAAQALFGPNIPSLRYLTGQPVPPGQHPLKRASASREASSSYLLTGADGSERTAQVSAKPLPSGRTAAVFRDTTALHESERRERVASARQKTVLTLLRRLSQARTAEAIGQIVAEEVHHLLSPAPGVQVRMYLLDPLTDTLTCLASAPDDRPKRPRSAASLQPATTRFDVQIPELWQLYVARQPFGNSLPLLSGGIAIGHLSVTAPRTDGEWETLEMIAALVALALAGPAARAQAAALAVQATALHEIAAALRRSRDHGEMADLAAGCIKRLIGADACTLSVPIDGKLSVLGQMFKDDLLFPKTLPNDACLHGKAVLKAYRTQKSVVQTGIANPGLNAGPWRAFAGISGCFTIAALPLAEKRGVLTVYTSGDAPLPDAQVEFLETVAALAAFRLAPATAKEGGAELPA